MKIKSNDFYLPGGTPVNLATIPTKVDPVYRSSKQYGKLLAGHVSQLSAMQELLYATQSHSILLIFQAMDAAGKDGAIKHIMSGVNPQGCQVFSYQHPSANELKHDFLWRTTRDLPERGRIGIFNRSYYEEVLIVRVHPTLLKAESIPSQGSGADSVWQSRYQSIRDLERHLHLNGTVVIKFFLHLSQQEQKKRFIERIDAEDKNWKISHADLAERQFWPEYMEAYEQCLGATSTIDSPWYVVPADDKNNSRLIVSRIILDQMTQLHMAMKPASAARLKELDRMRRELQKSD